MSESTAAISCGLEIPYLTMASTRKGAACSFVAHSSGAGALSQVDELGAMARRMNAAVLPAARGWRELLGVEDVLSDVGMARAEMVLLLVARSIVARVKLGRNFGNIVVYVVSGLLCRKEFEREYKRLEACSRKICKLV